LKNAPETLHFIGWMCLGALITMMISLIGAYFWLKHDYKRLLRDEEERLKRPPVERRKSMKSNRTRKSMKPGGASELQIKNMFSAP